MFLSIFYLIDAIILITALIIGANPFNFINIPGINILSWALAIVMLILSVRGLKRGGKKSGNVKKKDELPFNNKFNYPYKDREFNEDITQYLEGEQLYLSGQRGKAKLIWNRLCKKYNIDSGHAMICYYLDKNDPENAVKYAWAGSSHGYAAFNLGLIYYRASVYNYESESMDFSFKMDSTEFRKTVAIKPMHYIKYFRIAAMQDVPEAQYNLGYIYQNGIVKKNIFLALYWYYRGAMRGHGGCIRGLCEAYREILPKCDEWFAPKVEKAISRLEKWMQENPERICENKLILKHFGVTYHEKHERLDEVECYKAFVHQAVGMTNHTASYSNLSVKSSDNSFTFDRYALKLDYHSAIDSDERIPHFYPEIVFKGKGNVTYGTVITETKDFGVRSLTYILEDDLKKQMCAIISKNPYCVLAFEKYCNTLIAQEKITKHLIQHFGGFSIFVNIDDRGIASEKYVYIPPRQEVKTTYYTPPASEPESDFSYCSLFFSDGSDEYYIKGSNGANKLSRDVSNPNIFFDSSGNKYYSSDNGESVTKW